MYLNTFPPWNRHHQYKNCNLRAIQFVSRIVSLRAPNFAANSNLFCPQPVQIIARKYADRLVLHTAVRLNTFLLWNSRNQYKNRVQLFVVPTAYHRAHLFVVRCLRRCQAHVQAVALSAAFHHANNIVVKSAILLIFQRSHLLSVHLNVQFAVTTCARRTVVLPHPNNRHF